MRMGYVCMGCRFRDGCIRYGVGSFGDRVDERRNLFWVVF